MKKYLNEFFERYDYPGDAAETFLAAYEKFSENEDFQALYNRFITDKTLKSGEVDQVMNNICEETSVHPYTGKFLFYICCTKELGQKYKEAGIPEAVLWDTLEDFKYKLKECREVHGIWGFFSTTWYHSIAGMKCFKLGRMEYEFSQYSGEDVTVAGVTVTEGTKVINIHIPSSGEAFDKSARLASYDKAYYFFKDVLKADVNIFKCHSWLLNPDNREILGEKSNIISFMEDFKIVAGGVYEDNRSNMWRVFGAAAELPAEQLPRDTSMRRGYAEWLEKGNKPGYGLGLFVYDPVNKCTLS